MNVLIVKTSALGDIVHTFPCIAYIKNKIPRAVIDWVVEKPFLNLINTHPDINQVLTIDTKMWRKKLLARSSRKQIQEFVSSLQKINYDVIFDLQGNTKSAFVTAFAKSPNKVGFTRKDVSEWPNLLATNQKIPLIPNKNIRFDYLHLIKSYFNDLEEQDFDFFPVALGLSPDDTLFFDSQIKKISSLPRPWTLICAGSNWKNKQLSEKTLKNFLHLLHESKGGSLFFIWGTEEEKAEALNLQRDFFHSYCFPKLSLPLLQNTMKLMDLVVAVDSLPLHLAATTNVPTFSIFGASSAEKYSPLGTLHHSFQGLCPYGYTFDKRCHLLRKCKTGACIRSLSPEILFEAFKQKGF